MRFNVPPSVGLYISAVVEELRSSAAVSFWGLWKGFFFSFFPPQGQKASHAVGKNRNLILELVPVSSRWEITSAILYLCKDLSASEPSGWRQNGAQRYSDSLDRSSVDRLLSFPCLQRTLASRPCESPSSPDINGLIPSGICSLQHCQNQSHTIFPAGFGNHECTLPVKQQWNAIISIVTPLSL